MSSGSYFPGPVRAVEIPKDHGAGVRVLGVPNTADRIAQTAAAMLLEAKLEPIFHRDSYGYRPGRSAHDALAVARRRCWRQDWVLDIDVRAFFDSVPHDLLLKAVAHHTDERWVLLYIQRWLKAPMQMADGTLVAREKGTPQGSPISPLLANLFMHYAFDRWMDREHPGCPFERYADDVVVHCDTEEQARRLRAALAERLGSLGLELHPGKTKIVYCQDANRRGEAEHTSFDFLGYTFRGSAGPGQARVLRELRTGHEHHGQQGERPSDQGLAPQPSQRLGPVRHRPGNQSPGARLDQLLRGLLPLHVVLPGSGASTSISCDGPCRSSNDCAAGQPGHGGGWTPFDGASPPCSRTGTCCHPPHAGLWEPYDGRPSRTVLRGREGEAPSRYSPGSTGAGSFWDRVNEHQRRWSKLSPTRLIDEAARLSAAAGPRVRLPLLHPAPFEVAAGQNWGVSMVSLRVRDVPVVVTLAGHLPEIPADALDRSSQLQGVRLPVPASSRRSSPTPPSRPLGAVISDSVWGASVVGSGAGERRA